MSDYDQIDAFADDVWRVLLEAYRVSGGRERDGRIRSVVERMMVDDEFPNLVDCCDAAYVEMSAGDKMYLPPQAECP